MVRRRLTLWLALIALAAPASAAPGIVDASVSGSVFSARVELPGGIEADLTIAFEEVQNLTVESLGVSAQLINPLDPFFLARLPPGGLVGIPSAFPVLIQVAPPPGGGLEFTGVATISLHTHLLDLLPGVPLRLFSAPPGGHFTEDSASTGSGSFRVGSVEPDYNRDRAVLLDYRLLPAVIGDKLYLLEATLIQAASEIADPVLADLEARVDAIRDAYEKGEIAQAIAETEAFSTKVVADSGTAIPNRWRASGGLTNHAGRLRARAATLRFSLLGASGAP